MAKKIQINKNRSFSEPQEEESIYETSIELPQDFGVIPSSGIVKREDGSLEVSHIRIHRVGLEFTGDVSEDEYEIFGQTLLQIDTAYQWIIGDYLAYGVENNYGMAKDFAERLGRSEATVNNWTYVSRQVRFSFRNENLSFKHHIAVAPLSPDEQAYWLEKAVIGNGEDGQNHKTWSVKKLREEIAATNGDALAQVDDTPSRAFQLIAGWQKNITQNQWKKFSLSERVAVKSALDQLLNDIDEWENA